MYLNCYIIDTKIYEDKSFQQMANIEHMIKIQRIRNGK